MSGSELRRVYLLSLSLSRISLLFYSLSYYPSPLSFALWYTRCFICWGFARFTRLYHYIRIFVLSNYIYIYIAMFLLTRSNYNLSWLSCHKNKLNIHNGLISQWINLPLFFKKISFLKKIKKKNFLINLELHFENYIRNSYYSKRKVNSLTKFKTFKIFLRILIIVLKVSL